MAVRSEARGGASRPASVSAGLAAGADGSAAASLHPGAWLAWLAGGCAAVFLTSNPLYLSLGLLAALGVYLSVRETTKGRALTPFVALGLTLALLSVPFNVLTGSSGPSVLVTGPELVFPSWLGGLTLGGAITGEALVSATNRALGIAAIVALAGAFNASIDHFRLVRLTPRALSQLMLSLTVAIVVVPQSIAHARSVAEAQRLRGRPARGLRALPGLLLPALQGALERSVQRAESMDARGFGGGGPSGGALHMIIGVAGLGLCAWGAFAHFYYGAGLLPSVAILAGAGLVVAALVRGGRGRTNRLRRDRWTVRDSLVAAAAAVGVGMVVALRVSGAGDADYLAYPRVTAPAFHIAGAAAFVLLLLPAFLHAPGERTTEAAS